jgi:hypothetical protein
MVESGRDLSGVGNAVGMTIRGTRALTSHLALEASLPVALARAELRAQHVVLP